MAMITGKTLAELEQPISELADAIDVMSEDLEDVLDGLLDGALDIQDDL